MKKKNTKIICEICSSEMEFVGRVPTNKKYYLNRYECPCCDFKTTVCGDGYIDTKLEPQRAKEEAEKLSKIEEEARR